MSLEAQIAELVAKANSLIGVFNGRSAAIDAALSAAVNVAGSPTRQRGVHVDAVLGNDTTGDGSTAKPFKTIGRACQTYIPGGFLEIRLFSDQDHILDVSPFIVNAFIRFYVYGGTARARIRNQVFHQTTHKNYTHGFNNYNSFLIFHDIDIYTANYTDTAGPHTVFNGFIRRSDMYGGTSVVFNGKIVLGDTPFARNSSGICSHDIRLYNTSIERVGVNVPKAPVFDLEGMPGCFSVSGVVVPTGAAWANDLVVGIRRDAAGVPRNVVSNLVL